MPVNIFTVVILCLLPQAHTFAQVETQSEKPKANAFNPSSAVKTLRQFLQAVSQGKYERAYGLIAQSTKISGDTTLKDGRLDLNRFLSELFVDQERGAQLENQIKAREINPHGGLSAHISSLKTAQSPEPELASLKAKRQRTEKCGNYKIEEVTIINARQVEIAIMTSVANGIYDKDKAVLIKENGKWRITNPLHIIR
jgi:Domain of unknown function (DUF4878)